MRIALLFALLIAGCASASTQTSAPQREVEARLADMLAAASAPDASVESFAPFVVARGGDATRAWKSPADLSHESERRTVESVLGTIRGLLSEVRQPDGGYAYEVLEFVVESESEGQWHVLMVEFETDEKHEALFAFLPLQGTYYLGDIDR